MDTIDEESLGLGLRPGDAHYRAFVGNPANYDLVAAMTFNLLTTLGLRQHHRLLDIGCGSLRIGRLLIPYLNVGNYAGIEPEEWLMKEGVQREVGLDQVRIKQPQLLKGDSVSVLPSGSTFDFAIAQSVFSHCGKDLIGGWLRGTSDVLESNGALIATFVQGEADFAGTGWAYPKVVRYTANTVREMASEAGFRFHVLDWRHQFQVWGLFAKPDFDASWFANKPLTWNTLMDTRITPSHK